MGNSAKNLDSQSNDADKASDQLETVLTENESSANSSVYGANKDKLGLRQRLSMSRTKKYAIAGAFNLLIIWASTLFFIQSTPDRFVSKFTLLIPGAGAGSSINLDDLGQATTSVNSAYASNKVDPKTNYKAIAMSPVVIGEAAKSLEMSNQSFGKPRVKLIDQTTLLEVSLTADSEQLAYDKSVAYFNAIETTLSRLRSSELSSRRLANENVMESYRNSVEEAQSAVLHFQQESTIVLPEQFGDLVRNVESIKQKRNEALTKLESVKANLSQLENSLGISSAYAAAALKLHNDPIFNSLVDKVANLAAELVEKQAVWGRNHPKVKHAQARVNSAKNAMLNRADDLTGTSSYRALDNLYLSTNAGRSELFQSIIELTAARSAAESELNSYDSQIDVLESRTLRNASMAAKLQDLERSHQVATAIYVSAAAKADLGNSDIYASYPMTQLLMEPTRPNGPENFVKPIALLGAAIGSILVCLALLISWKRGVLLQKLQKRK